jgi:geranylgeranyl pyrophosphate synthase
MKLTIDSGLKNALKPELNRLNESFEKLAKETDGFLGDLLSYVLIGSGKRVRPALVMLTSRLGTADLESVRAVSAAVELIHIATLIHDDVIDKSALRRGRKTVYSEYGVDTAVLLGDHIYTYAFEKVAELNNPLILKLMARSTSIMCSGEIDQLRRRFQFDLSEAEYFSFIEKKTASLFGVSARAGAILSGQSVTVQNALESYGINLGKAFQITDDLLDLTGKEVVVGKTLRTDLLNGKMTLPLIHFRDHSSPAFDVKKFFETLDSKNGHISGLIDLLEALGKKRLHRVLSD